MTYPQYKPIVIGPDGLPSEPSGLNLDPDTVPLQAGPYQEQPNWPNEVRRQLTGSNVIPSSVASQMRPWHMKTGAYETGPAATQPQFDVSLQNPSYRPNPSNIYRAAGVPLRAGDKILPESYFDHNIPYAIRVPDGRVIQAQGREEFGQLLMYIMHDGGLVEDPSIPAPIKAYSMSEVQGALDKGDFANADWMMYQNYRAGNISKGWYEAFANNPSVLSSLVKNNPQAGTFNLSKPTDTKYISAQDYVAWADRQKANVASPHYDFETVQQEAETLANYLWQVKYARQRQFLKDYADEIKENGFHDTLEVLSKSEEYKKYFPDYPQNFMDWDEIPDEWLVQDKDGNASVPAGVNRFPSALKKNYDRLKADYEAHISAQLPKGFTAKVEQGGWTTPFYEIQFYTPDGQVIGNDGSPMPPEVFKFTGGEIEEYKRWAKSSPPDYLRQMTAVAVSNPGLAVALVKATNPDWTDEQSKGWVNGIVQQKAADKALQLKQKIGQIAENPTANGLPDPIAKFITQRFIAGGYIITNFLENASNTFTENELQPIQTIINAPGPDRLKLIALGMLAMPAWRAKEGLQAFADLWNVLNDTFSAIRYFPQWEASPYRVWLQEKNLPVPEEDNPTVKAVSAVYGISDTKKLPNPTEEELSAWYNPANFIGPAEAISIFRGLKGASAGEKIIAEMFVAFNKGKGMVEVTNIAKRGAGKVEGGYKALMDDFTSLLSKSLREKISPATFKGEPRLVEPKPSTPIKDIVETPEGPKAVEVPEYRKADPNEPIAGRETYTDTVTGQKYVSGEIPKETVKETPAAEAPKGGVKNTSSPQVPVQSEGELKQSQYYQRVNEGIERDMGHDPVYNEMSLKTDTERAIRYVNDTPDDAKKVALGLKKAPSDVTATAISRAYIEKLRESGMNAIADDIEQRLSLKLTRSGQEIVAARGRITDNSVTSFINQALDAKMEAVARKTGAKNATKKVVTEQMGRDVENIKAALKKSQLDLSDIDKQIDMMICPE